MAISVFDLFSVGIGPSSSHTVGPMRAASMFVRRLREAGLFDRTTRVHAQLFGSLGATGHGHGSPKAVMLGLEGEQPELCDPSNADDRVAEIRRDRRLTLGGQRPIEFVEDTDLVMHRRKQLPLHPNGMSFAALDADGTELDSAVYYSVGGGFIVDETASGTDRIKPDSTPLAHPFTTGDELLARTRETGLSISDIMLANELAWREESEVRSGLLHIWQVMQDCVERGCTVEGVLPGGLKVRRRAADLRRGLSSEHFTTDPLRVMDWVTLFALAVNEENAAGGRVVTAPTNGAAGIVPAVLHYYARFVPGANEDGVVRFLLAAGAVGVLFKENASISGAEVGCQGEVGSAPPVPWPQPGSPRCWAAPPSRWRTPPRSPWSTTSA